MQSDTVMLKRNEGDRREGQRRLTVVSKGMVKISLSGKLEEGERAQRDLVHIYDCIEYYPKLNFAI